MSGGRATEGTREQRRLSFLAAILDMEIRVPKTIVWASTVGVAHLGQHAGERAIVDAIQNGPPLSWMAGLKGSGWVA